MTNVQNSKIIPIPLKEYSIDSLKILWDIGSFTDTNIPQIIVQVDKETGEELCEIKKAVIPIKYNDSEIYIGKYTKVVPIKASGTSQTFEKLILYFSSKIETATYFNGIDQDKVVSILEFLKNRGTINYNNVTTLLRQGVAKDVDIKIDILLNNKKLGNQEFLTKFHQGIKTFFRGNNQDDCNIFKNKNNQGIQCYDRPKSTLKKTFCKGYNKSLELVERKGDFHKLLPKNITQFLRDNLVYRFEYTIKDSKHMKHYGYDKDLLSYLNLTQAEMGVIAQEIFHRNFRGNDITIPKAYKMNINDKLLVMHFKHLLLNGSTEQDIQDMYMGIMEKTNKNGNSANNSRVVDRYKKVVALMKRENNDKFVKCEEFVNTYLRSYTFPWINPLEMIFNNYE